MMKKLDFSILLIGVCISASGFAQLMLSLVLNVFFKMDRLYFIDDWLSKFPLVTMCLGIVILSLSMLSIIATFLKNRIALWVYIGLMSITVMVQLVNIYISGQVQSLVTSDLLLTKTPQVDKFITDAIDNGNAEDVEMIFELQEHFGCCGVTRHTFWRGKGKANGDILDANELPQSCCVNCKECNCGGLKNFFGENEGHRDRFDIYEIGCLNIIGMKFNAQLKDIFNYGYMVFAMASAALEVLSIVLSVQFVLVLQKTYKMSQEA